MKRKALKYKLKTTVIVLFLTASTFSCEKDSMKMYEPDCETGNCVSVNIKGSLIVKPSGEGLKIKNVPIEVYFSRITSAWIPAKRRIILGKTNKNGDFDFRVTIDTKSFEDNYLIVKVPAQKNYFCSSEFGVERNNFKIYSKYNEEVLKNITFEFYKKTNLSINLNRTNNDDIETLYVHQFFDGKIDAGNSMHILSEAELVTINKVQHETAADVYTYIHWRKLMKNGEDKSYVDSLICKPNVNNVYTINF